MLEFELDTNDCGHHRHHCIPSFWESSGEPGTTEIGSGAHKRPPGLIRLVIRPHQVDEGVDVPTQLVASPSQSPTF
jgi:hypothetical protein